MGSYLLSHLRQNRKTFLYLIVFAVAVTFIFSGLNQCTQVTYYADDQYVKRNDYSSEIGTPISILAISCFVLPVLEFQFFKKRRNLDCAYSLPISRTEMGIVHYVTGLLLLVIPYTCSYILNFVLMLRYPGEFYLTPLLGHYFICLVLAVCFYSVFVFVYNQANSSGDGIWFIILWSLVFLVFMMDYEVIMDKFYNDYYRSQYQISNPLMGMPLLGLSEITYEYARVVERSQWGDLNAIWTDTTTMVMMVLWLVLGVASVIGFYFTFGKRGAQKTEEISESWVGYKLMIPVYAFSGMLLVYSAPGMWLIIEGIALVGYMIYRKGFHLQKTDWIVLACLLLFALTFGTVFAFL